MNTYILQRNLDIEGIAVKLTFIKICDVTRFNVIFCKYFGYKHFT